MNAAQEFAVGPARYARDRFAVRCPSPNGMKTRAARLIGDALRARWSGRESAYIATAAQVRKLELLYGAGFDASFITGELCHDALRLRSIEPKAAVEMAERLNG